uniref:Leucine-rich repeat protein n=1 Tax=viral metagenome TaxID=1070528 RepID=A0A6C0C7Y6_9ZZZZ
MLKELIINENKYITGRTLHCLTNLKSLSLVSNELIDNKTLREMTNLTKLEFSGDNVCNDTLIQLTKN